MEKCKQEVQENFIFRRCSRNAWKDGYCKQHHPDIVKAKREESDRKWKEKWDNSPLMLLKRKVDQLSAENAELAAALKGYVNKFGNCGPVYDKAISILGVVDANSK